ncbi:spore germination protein KA [Sporobacter termitidis DSM 10068]|uniref:Spore germination protein KA n=1 Tax=Sporobacter termitidis DSM 10068 TaxID=1123282 RepID=A0A1M5X4B7_9FIRM|nr:spore germination protein [Sporobacter termitidis]SHH94656.1 spore germination protein KA [Sporobacter termitidis DSM 10068]
MFDFLLRKAGYWFAKKQETYRSKEPDKDDTISKNLTEVLNTIRNETIGSKDVVIREIYVGGDVGADAAIVYIDGLVSSKIINDDVIKPLMFDTRLDAGYAKKDNVITYIEKSLIAVNEIEEVGKLSEALNGALSGDVALFLDGIGRAVVINSKGWEKRSITEPSSEAVIRGPRESFIENMRTNTALIRRKIKNSSLVFEQMVIGRKTKTNVSIAYINGLAKPELIAEVKKRIKGISTDSILESGYIEQFIEDAPGSIFATIGYTEKPDVAAAKILEGRVAIIVDGTPFVLTAPFVFLESFQAAEDYYFRPYFATMTRIIRIIGYAITVLAPAFYVAVTTYHQELIPTSLLITFASAREGVPFPAFVESLIMIITFEILREAGIRLPRPVGQALSIVGALVIGESAVSAGLIGAPMVIVVAITAVSGFLVPNQNDSAVIMRIILLILAATFGGFGITMGLLAILVHMSALESFGYPFLSPTVPFDLEDSKDAVVRAPLWLMISRPKGMSEDKQRKKYKVPPTEANNNDSGEASS